MPNYNNAARNYHNYPEYEEYEQPVPTRRPANPATSMPDYRTIGLGGPLARQQSAPPPPLPGAMPRRQLSGSVNVPPAMSRGYAEETRRPIRPVQTRRPAPASSPLDRFNLQSNGSNAKLAIMGVVLLGVLVVSYLIVSFAVQTWQTWQDDMTYGRPRITRLEANVGHNEVGGNKTLFLAHNLKGQISITEFPGGDPAKTRVIVGPNLFGKDKDLVPIKLQVKDVNGDGQPDLIAAAADQQLVYINENGNFRPINDQERAKLKALEKEDTK